LYATAGISWKEGLAFVKISNRHATHEENKVEEETDTLHSLTTVQLVIDQEGGHVVSNERDSDVDQVPEPSSHDALGIRVP
jgi:hypothetical protein